MKIVETRVYRGPNLYALWPVIRLQVDLGELEDFPTLRLPGFVAGLVEMIPSLHEHTCSYEEPGGFIRRMSEDEGTWLGHVLEHVAIELQCLVGHRVSFGKTRGAGLPRGHYNVVYSFRDEAVGLAAGELARAVLCHLLPPCRAAYQPEPLDFPARLAELRRLAEARALGPSTAALVRAAEKRGIPWSRLDDGSLLQLGYGRHQRRLALDGQSGDLRAAAGLTRDAARPLLDLLFPRGRPFSIPIAAITGTNGKTTTTRMVGHILTVAGFTVGMATTDGVYVGGELVAAGDLTGPWAANLVLSDPTVDVAVLETARGGLVRSGLAFRSCDVGAVLNVGADHLGLGGVETLADLARVKQIVVEVARDLCVLNADDERVARMARVSPAAPVYVSLDRANPRLSRHLQDGGRAVVLAPGARSGSGVEAGRLLVLDGDDEIPLIEVRRIPATLDGHARHNVQNALFAAAIAHGLGASWEAVRRGLATFAQDYDHAPGRLNLFDVGGFRVLLDYAHNPPAMAAMVQTVRALADTGRRIGVLAAPGDRRDDDVRALGRAAAPGFDLILLRDDADLRGRAPGEVAALLRQGLLAAGFAPDCILPGVLPEPEAVDRALDLAEPGDLVALFGEDLEICHQRIEEHSRRPAEAPRLAAAR